MVMDDWWKPAARAQRAIRTRFKRHWTAEPKRYVYCIAYAMYCICKYQLCYFVFLQRFIQGFSLVKNISERFEIGNWWEKNGTVRSNLGGCYCFFAKRPQPESMNHVHPITLLSCLYRLASKVLADQIGNHLSSVVPLPVSGGRRGVKDLAFLEKLTIEETLVSDTHLCGFSLHLVKAFKTFPRLPLSITLQKMGVPSWTCTFSLNHYRYL